MRKLRLLLIAVGVASILLNAVFAGIALRFVFRADQGTMLAIFFSLPDALRRDLRQAISRDGDTINDARQALMQSRSELQELMAQDSPDIEAIAEAMAALRQNTERMQIEVHAAMMEHFIAQSSE